MPLLSKYTMKLADSPFWTFAIHDGQHIDPRVLPYQKLKEEDRLREEDPYTALIAELPCNRFIMETSRFQLDINRGIDDAIYLRPDQAWGLDVWRKDVPEELVNQLRLDHEAIYAIIESNIQQTISKYGYFVILDIHSYNARREGPEQEINTDTDPQINIGTLHLNAKWHPLLERLMYELGKEKVNGEPVDIRENIKFKGGYLSKVINQLFGEYGAVFAIEFRKDFMDEWTGIPVPHHVEAYKQLMMKALTVLNQYFYYDGKE